MTENNEECVLLCVCRCDIWGGDIYNGGFILERESCRVREGGRRSFFRSVQVVVEDSWGRGAVLEIQSHAPIILRLLPT